MTLRIQCPACQRQFKVDEELKGRIVECGACEKQFLVDADTLVEQRERYFPGDFKKPGLDHYGRAPDPGRGAEPVQFATASYDQRAKAADVTPAPPQRTFAGALGVVIQIFFAIILLVGAREDGALGGMELQKRIILAGFVVLVGASLILYGAFRRRLEAVLTMTALGAVVMGLAIFLRAPEEARPVAHNPAPAGENGNSDPAAGKLTELEVKELIGYRPVENAITDFGYEGVVALWVPILKSSFRYQVLRYLHRKTGTAERPSIYNRHPGGLIVIEGTRLTIAELERVVERFATVDEVYPNIRVLQITIQGERLIAPSTELAAKLGDPEHSGFYRLNEEELDHIDLDRIREAAHRLANAEPKTRRPQIAARLVELLDEDPDPEFLATICDAIMVWSEPGDGADQAVARVAQDIIVSNETVPRSMVRFLISRQSPEALSILEMLWEKEPSTWEPLIVDFGKDAEDLMITHLRSEDRNLQRSAITILKRVGTAASLPPLREALQQAGGDEELQLVIRSAIEVLEAE